MTLVDKAQKMQCGCHGLTVTSHCDRPVRRHNWTESLSLQDLEKDLGPSSEAWFDNLTREHDLKQNDYTAANTQTGWSPCPAGGVINLSATTSTPVHMKMMFQYDSPVLWPTLLPESPLVESTILNKSGTSEDEAEEEEDSSMATVLGLDGDKGDDQQRLLAFSADSTTDLSWSSSMATPPSSDLKKNPLPDEGEKEKVIARALFTPNNSAEDSELGETSINVTVEQEEVSASLFTSDISHSESPSQGREYSLGTCRNCRTLKGDACAGQSADTACCDCAGRPVVEIHCTDSATPWKASGLKNSRDQSPAELTSQQKVPNIQFLETCESGNSFLQTDEMFVRRQNAVQHNEDWTSELSVLKNSCGGNSRSVMNSSQFNTSTPKGGPVNWGGHEETPPSRKPLSRRRLNRLATKPRDLSNEFTDPVMSSVGKALADFFSSPETSVKRAPPKRKTVAAVTSAWEKCEGGEVKPGTDVSCCTMNEQVLGTGEVEGAHTPQPAHPEDKESNLSTWSGERVHEDENHHEQMKSDIDSQCTVKTSDVSLNGEKCVTPEAVASSAYDHTPKREISVREMCVPDNLSPITAATPPSILKATQKQSRSSLSSKRVRFLEDSLDMETDTPKTKRMKIKAPLKDDDETKGNYAQDQQSILGKEGDAVKENVFDNSAKNVKENKPWKLSSMPALSTSSMYEPSETKESQSFNTKKCEASAGLSVLESQTEIPAVTPVSQVPVIPSRDTFGDDNTHGLGQKGSLVSKNERVPPAKEHFVVTVPKMLQPGVPSGEKIIKGVSSGGLYGTECQESDEKINCAVKNQMMTNVTMKSGEGLSKECQEQNQVTPQIQSAQSKRKPGVGGRKMVPRFLYPTSSQILKTCPQRVFDFSPAGVSIGQQPQAKVVEHHQHEEKPAEGPVVSNKTENTVKNSGVPCQPTSPSTNPLTRPQSLSHDVNCVVGGTSETGRMYFTEKCEPNTSERNENRMEEDPDWSDIEHFGGDVSDVETEAKIDDQPLEESLPEDKRQFEAGKLVITDERSISLKPTTRENICTASTTAERSSCTGEVYTDGKSLLRPLQENDLNTSDMPDSPQTVSPTLATLSPVKPSEQNLGISFSRPHADPSVADHLDLEAHGSHSAPVTCHTHVQSKIDIANSRFEEDQQNELLLGVDFSQELLSQSKSCLPEAFKEKDDELDVQPTESPLPASVETDLPSPVKEGDAVHQDSEKVTMASSPAHPEKEAADQPGWSLNTASPDMSLSQEQAGMAGTTCQESPASKRVQTLCEREPIQALSVSPSLQTSGICSGFRSAAGKVLQPTKEALASAKAFFEDDAAVLGNVDLDDFEEKTVEPEMPGNILPSGVTRTIKDDHICRADGNSNESRGKLLSCKNETPSTDDFTAVSRMGGFKTASGKDFSLSSAGQKKAEDMWKAVLKETQIDTNVGGEDTHPGRADLAHNQQHSTCAEMKTTSNTLSKTCALSEAVSKFTDISGQKKNVLMETLVINTSTSFQTAGGKTMYLSSKSKQKALDLWNSVEGELGSVDFLPDAESKPVKSVKSVSPLNKGPGMHGTKNSMDEVMPRNLSGEEPIVSRKTLSHSSPSPGKVPQGYKPFKAPTVIRTVSEEERYTTKVPECPTVHQKNTILHHFSPVEVTNKKNGINCEGDWGFTRKHSDEFSDDDDVWNAENMEEMLKGGLGQQGQCQATDQSSMKQAHVSKKRTQSTSSDFNSGNVLVDLNYEESHENSSSGQTGGGHASRSVQKLKGKAAPQMHVRSKYRHEHGGKNNDANIDDEEMSEAVLTDLSLDMHEATESTSPKPTDVPVMQTVSSSSVCLKKREVERECQDMNLGLPIQDSPKSLVMGNASFESLRWDENISYDDKELSLSPVELKRGGNAEDHLTTIQTAVLDLKESDFDSSIPDPATDSAFGKDGMGQTDDDDDDIESSSVEKDFVEMCGLESELDRGQVEVSGGVVWTDDNHKDTLDNKLSREACESVLPVHSYDAVLEEKHYQALPETEDALSSVRQDMEGIDDIFAGDCFDNDPVGSDVGLMLGVPTAQEKVELRSTAVGETPLQNNNGKQLKILKGRESVGANMLGNSSVFQKDDDRVTGKVDSLCDVSWSEISCTLNPSQWGDGKKTCEPHDATERSDVAGAAQHIDAGGDSHAHSLFAPYSSCSTPYNIPQSKTPKTMPSMSETSDKNCVVNGKSNINKEADNVLSTSAERDLTHCTDSEGFQITADLSQLFSSQRSQTVIQQPSGVGDAFLGSQQKTDGQLSGRLTSAGSVKGRSSCLGFGFQTAAGKSVCVSVNSLEKVKHLFASEMESTENAASLAPLHFLPSSPAARFTAAAAAEAEDSENVAHCREVPKCVLEMNKDGSYEADQPTHILGGNTVPPTKPVKYSNTLDESVCHRARSDNFCDKLDGNFCYGIKSNELKKKAQSVIDGNMPHLEEHSCNSDCACMRNEGLRDTKDPVTPIREHFPGFQTAGGANVTVSKMALAHARSVLYAGENQENYENGHDQIMEQTEEKIHTSAGHQTAKGGNVTKTVTSPLQTLVQSFSNSEHVSRQSGTHSSIRTSHIGFQTARGSKVSVSAKSLQHARQVLSSAEEGNDEKDKKIRDEADVLSTSRRFQGFETARGKPICISEHALVNARKMLDAAEKDKNANHSEKTSTDGMSENSQQNNSGVSDSPKTNRNVSVVQNVSADQGGSHVPPSRTCGFQTAGGKSVTVSKKALQHAQNVLRADGDLEPTQTMKLDSVQPRSFSFQTASGNSVSISDRALKHARGFFQEDADFHSVENVPPKTTGSELRCAPSVKDPNSMCDSLPTVKSVPSPPQTTDFCVPTVSVCGGELLESSVLHQHCVDSSVSSEGQGRGKGKERRSKEGLLPVFSDDSRGMMEDMKHSEDCHGRAGKGDRVSVKRMAVCADSEAILHDRSAKRLKLLPLTACDGTDRMAKRVPKPFIPPVISSQSNPSPPKCPYPTKSTSTFQPPYKKPKFSPPLAQKSTGDTAAAQKPRFKPPPQVNTSECVSDVANKVSSTQSHCSDEEPRTSEDENQAEKAKISGGQNDSSHVSGRDVDVKMDEAKTLTWRNGVGTSHSDSALRNVSLQDRSEDTDSSRCGPAMVPSDRRGQTLAIEEARMHQEKIIRQKKRQKIKPVQGRWLSQKLIQGKMSLVDVCGASRWRSKKQLQQLGVSLAVCSISSSNAEEFRFHLPSFYPAGSAGLLVGDGAFLVPSVHGYAGKEEFYTAFLTVDGVDPALVTEAWVFNHYRWIVWKLAAYEVALPDSFASRALTPDTVMYQLKYRYDREVDLCHRSALKRIVERDDTPCKRLVLCVSGIKTVADSDQNMLEVTDGWYNLPCKPDSALQTLIDSKKLGVGQKVVASGAELSGSSESCSPLELSSGLYLKVHGNSTRPAPGGARLGYQRDPTPLCVPLSTLHPQGGLVGCVDVVVVRKYPLMFMEKLAQGGYVFRTVEMEEKARRKHEEQQQAVMEKLCSQLQAQMEAEECSAKKGHRKRSLKREEVQCLTSGADISDAMDTVPHPEELQSMLSSSQVEELVAFRSRQREERQQRLSERLQDALKQSSSQDERSVTPLQKLRIVGSCRRDIDSKIDVMLTVWRPGLDWENVQEGKRYRIYALTASPARSHALGGTVELSAGRQTRLQALRIEENLLDLLYEPREISCISDLRHKNVPYNEVDFVGLVINIKSALRGSDAVYAVDPKGDLLLIWFWGGLQMFSLQDTLREGIPFAACNLRLKSSAKEVVECCASLEMSHFSANGKTASQRQLVQRLKQKDLSQDLLKRGQEKLSRIRSSFKPAAAPASEMLEDLPPSFLDKLMAPLTQETNNPSTASVKTSSHILVPNTSRTPPSKLLSSSTSLNTSFNTSLSCDQPQSPSDREVERKRKMQREKLGRLAAYGRAPVLTPLPSAMSPAAGRAFKPPTPRGKR